MCGPVPCDKPIDWSNIRLAGGTQTKGGLIQPKAELIRIRLLGIIADGPEGPVLVTTKGLSQRFTGKVTKKYYGVRAIGDEFKIELLDFRADGTMESVKNQR